MKKFLILGSLLTLTLTSASAQSYKGKTEVGLQAGAIFFEGDSVENEDGVYGGRIGHYLTENWSLEAGAVAGETEIEGTTNKVDVLLPMIEAQYNFGSSAIRPFLAAGLGGLFLRPDVGRDEDDFVGQWGAGLKWAITNLFTARLDARHVLDADHHVRSNNATVTGGLSLLFGGSASEKPAQVVQAPAPTPTPTPTPAPTPAQPAAPAPVDTDGDGVYDDQDDCAGTPAGTAVDARGCPQEAKAVPQDNWVLTGVQFETASDRIKTASTAALDEAAGILTTRTRVRVEIQGHTDSVGGDAANQTLSERRAVSVKNYLVGKGVSADRLETKGYGESQPVADNATPEGRAQNRRIEFKVLSR